MKQTTQNKIANDLSSLNSSEAVEITLRLIANLPAPEGLEDRVYANLRAAQQTTPRKGRLLAWPAMPWPSRDWMRSAAAAAIVLVVAGGGWGIYTRVQPARSIAAPPHVAAPAGFSSAGAMRTPNTLNGPVVKHPATAKLQPVKSPTQKLHHRVKPTAANKAAAQPVAPAAK
jgi:hypothetical protein